MASAQRLWGQPGDPPLADRSFQSRAARLGLLAVPSGTVGTPSTSLNPSPEAPEHPALTAAASTESAASPSAKVEPLASRLRRLLGTRGTGRSTADAGSGAPGHGGSGPQSEPGTPSAPASVPQSALRAPSILRPLPPLAAPGLKRDCDPLGRTVVPDLAWLERGDPRSRWSQGTTVLPGHWTHGRSALETFLGVDARAAVLLSGDDALLDFDPARALFFDLETTGLLGGAKGGADASTGRAFPFVIGLLRMHPSGGFELRQHLLSSSQHEPAALDEVDQWLRDAETLISFNGRAFDRHLLAERHALCRMDDPGWLKKPHLDLLHPSRRLAKDELPSTTLGNLERHWLQVRRGDDLPGSEVPAAWARWRSSGDDQWVLPVLRHNLLDLLSLLTLTVHLRDAVAAPREHLGGGMALLAAAKLLLLRGAVERAVPLLDEIAAGDDADPRTYGALRMLVDARSREGEADAVRQPLLRMIELAGASDPWPWRRLIQLEERGGAGPEAALRIARRWTVALGDSPLAALDRPEVERRLTRLERRVTRAQGRGEGEGIET